MKASWDAWGVWYQRPLVVSYCISTSHDLLKIKHILCQKHLHYLSIYSFKSHKFSNRCIVVILSLWAVRHWVISITWVIFRKKSQLVKLKSYVPHFSWIFPPFECPIGVYFWFLWTVNRDSCFLLFLGISIVPWHLLNWYQWANNWTSGSLIKNKTK